MPDRRYGHAIAGRYMEEGVLAGIGVLLVCTGVFSSGTLTILSAIAIGCLLFAAAWLLHRSKRSADPVPAEPPEEEADEVPDEAYLREQYRHSTAIDQEYFEPAPPPVREPEPPPVRTERRSAPPPQYSASDFVEEPSRTSMSQHEPHSEFSHLLVKVLQAVKEVCFAHTAAFFWVNHGTRQLVAEAKVTDSASFTAERKIPLGGDVVSRIGTGGEPQIVNSILAETERDMLRYYTSLQDVRSFIGVPVFLPDASPADLPVAVIAVDSKAEDAFGPETFSVLSHFSKLTAAMLMSYTEKFDLMAGAKLVEADRQLKRRVANRPTVASVVNGFMEQLETTLPWDALAVVLFDEHLAAWAVAAVRVRGSERFVAPKQTIDMERSIVGQAVRNNRATTVDLRTNTGMVFNASESGSTLLKQGTLAVVPLSSNGKSFGAAAVVHSKQGALTPKDVAAAEYLAATVAPSFEVMELNALINEHIAVDELTGALSNRYFTVRLAEEVSRASDRSEDLTLALVTLSGAAEIEQRYGIEGKEAALKSVARHLRAGVRPYDIVARFDLTTFAVVLTDTIANDAYLWAEKMRIAIAGGIVSYDTKSFSISVTIGISGAAAKMAPDELVKNTLLVLEQAKKSGGNIVRVF